MFSIYPDEWPGAGLFLLRVASGVALIARGVSFLLSWRDLKFTAAAIALLVIAAATLLLIGYLTRFGAVLVALASVCGIFFWSSVLAINFFETRLTAALVGLIAMALVCLGPGAFSLDARLFGRREIIFPENRSEK